MPNQYTLDPRHITVTCAPCGRAFTAKLSVVQKGGGKFCSRVCKGLASRGVKLTRAGSSVLFNDGVVAHIPLYTRQGAVCGRVIIDADDVEWVTRHRWSLNEGYARHDGEYLHRRILGLTPDDGMEGDHINRDRLDCRRTNLRAIPGAGNRQNHPGRGGTSLYRGVSWDSKAEKWFASVQSQGRTINLGLYESEAEAAAAARAARRELMPYATD